MRTATINDPGRPTLAARKLTDGRLALEQAARGTCCYLTATEALRLVDFIRDTGPRAVSPSHARMVRWDASSNTVETVRPAQLQQTT